MESVREGKEGGNSHKSCVKGDFNPKLFNPIFLHLKFKFIQLDPIVRTWRCNKESFCSLWNTILKPKKSYCDAIHRITRSQPMIRYNFKGVFRERSIYNKSKVITNVNEMGNDSCSSR